MLRTMFLRSSFDYSKLKEVIGEAITGTQVVSSVFWGIGAAKSLVTYLLDKYASSRGAYV